MRYQGILVRLTLVVFIAVSGLLGLQYYTSLPNYITNPVRKDGFGAQFQTLIYSVIYAEQNGYKFAYTPFKSMEHNYTNTADFIQRKEWLINFKDNFPSVRWHPTAKVLSTSTGIAFCENNINICAKSYALQKVKTIFRANKPKDYFANNKFNVAIHIRRPNSHDMRLTGADVPDEVFLQFIQMLKLKYKAKDILIHIYSQGAPENFALYMLPQVKFHLDESIEDSFMGMVFADALVMSPSSFSYVAGMLSNGDVYYMPFWHQLFPQWHILK